MARKTLIRQSIYPYHVTIRSNNKDWFDLPLTTIWDYCIKSLHRAHCKVPVKIEAFVLMNNHYHLLLYTPNSDLDKFMQILNSTLSYLIRDKTGRINHIFGGRYKWSLINKQSYYQNVVRYIFQNPLRANLCENPEDYNFSTIYYQVRKYNLPFSLPELFLKKEYLDFIHKKPSPHDLWGYKHALRSIGEFRPKA